MKQIVFLLLATSIFISGVAQDPFCETIISQGKSTVKQVPEIISFFVEFELSHKDYDVCTDLALGKIDTFKMKLKEKDIDEDLIKTASYSIQELTDRDNRTRELIHLGYQARIPILVKLEVTDPKTNVVLELLKSTFKAETRINFELSQKQRDEAKEALLTLAVKDATSTAEILASSLSVHLGKVIKVQYGDPQILGNFTGSQNDLRSTERLMAASSVSSSNITTLTPPEISMAASVVLAFEIEYN
jgi:uncharacterized protein YggE